MIPKSILLNQGRLTKQADIPGQQTALMPLANIDGSGLHFHPYASIDKHRDALD